jgi:hypothetical protein
MELARVHVQRWSWEIVVWNLKVLSTTTGLVDLG